MEEKIGPVYIGGGGGGGTRDTEKCRLSVLTGALFWKEKKKRTKLNILSGASRDKNHVT